MDSLISIPGLAFVGLASLALMVAFVWFCDRV